MSRTLNMLEKIEAADSREEVYALLLLSERYLVGQRTRNRWHSRARRKLTQLRNGQAQTSGGAA